jgi:hypothetical protein
LEPVAGNATARQRIAHSAGAFREVKKHAPKPAAHTPDDDIVRMLEAERAPPPKRTSITGARDEMVPPAGGGLRPAHPPASTVVRPKKRIGMPAVAPPPKKRAFQIPVPSGRVALDAYPFGKGGMHL